MAEDKSAAILSELRALHETYRQRLASDIPELQNLADALASSSEPAPLLEDLKHALHRMAGSAGTFGFPELGAAARNLEIRIQEWMHPSGTTMPTSQDLLDLQHEVHALRGQIPKHPPRRRRPAVSTFMQFIPRESTAKS
ncbi:Hpt domain-containing protein [Desulfonatronum sp. SC1]|uniref:Hpt domain-containing protein n=1 Tax=Desulfonatronum sp. SC1 TaxID=2109626 RepID=UPI000D314B49|nr:Hpt domain-containing protein [Desulfonatronum sp. SC1]PTN39031.1 hypothetical protein C6366_00935 [Desulfonatronum sp. SC1]